MFKKIMALVIAVVMLAAMCTCFSSCNSDKDKFKIGMICLHDEKSTYDKNFIEGLKEAQETLGLKDDQVIILTGIPEGDECYQKACDLVDQGCDVIFADSFGHEPFMIKAAREFPDVQFCHATGTKAHTEGLSNFHNAFASIYEGRYLAGVAAGLKLNAMIEDGTITAEQAKIGYVGAWPYAEVKSGYTAFFLGARSVCSGATMEVSFTNSWLEETAEKNTALALIDSGCVLISQHADSMGAPGACESKNVPNVSYNGSTEASCPNTFIVSSRINWAPYFELIVKSVRDNDGTIPADYTGTIATGSVVLTDFGAKATASGTKEAINEIKAKLEAGTLHVFDTDTFTVQGEKLTTYKADVDDMGDYVGETEVVKDGYFSESEYRSAPYFNIDIDGITIK